MAKPIVRCVHCWQPVSMRLERAEYRVAFDGGWVHLSCYKADQDPTTQLYSRIFAGGPPGISQRRRLGETVAAEKFGPDPLDPRQH